MHRQHPFSTGGNPNGSFNSITSNTMSQNMGNKSYYNFRNSFAHNQPLIEKPDFQNRNNVIHNNMGETLLNEQIIEYQLHVDSKDRTVTTYDNPFKFVVSFGGVGRKTHRKKVKRKTADGKEYYETTEEYISDGTPGPIISREFKNVKYIKLDYVILPRTLYITKDPSGNYIKSENNTLNLARNKYLIVKIKELGSNKIASTNSVIGDDSFLIYPDKFLGTDNVLWITSYGSRIFNNSLLGNISRLTFQILTPNGEVLTPYDSELNKEIVFADFEKDSSSKYSTEEFNTIKNEIIPDLQCNISLLMGVVENELNISTKYEA
jgi:hypothetical protein